MKLASLLFCSVLVASAGPASAAPLDQKSKMTDWSRASQAEKDAWIAAFEFRQSGIDKSEVSVCLDDRAREPVFENNDLSGVTLMCGSIAALP